MKKLGFQGIEKHIFRILRVCQTQVKNNNNYGKTLLQADKRLNEYITDNESVFRTKTDNVLDKAKEYLKGLWISRLSNLEKITETGATDNYHNQ